MIRVTIHRDEQNHIRSFTVVGHADFAEHGKDIVCAGVSTAVFGTVNAIESLLKIELDCDTDEKDGLFSATIPEKVATERNEQLQLLLETMVVMLESIEESYSAYITIQQR